MAPPSDEEIAAVFRTRQDAFERLKKMAIQDSNRLSFISATEVAGQLNEPRKQEYRQLILSIHRNLRVTTSDGAVRFIFASGGTSAIGPGWLKGIEFVPGDTARVGVLTSNLDNVAAFPAGEVYLRKVAPDWYVVVQKTD
jgi:hypothetical protein